jgi:hypothetical protein
VADQTPGRQRRLGLRIEIIIESFSCGLALIRGRRICAIVIAPGLQPALGKVVAAWWQDSDRGHDVSILMALIGVVG